MANQKLFISYAHVDKWYVNQLVETLRDGGYDPWYDHSLVPGQNWKVQLLAAIQECSAFIYAMTPESTTSQWCLWELKKAAQMGKPIIPVRLQTNATLPDILKDIQWVDFSDGPTPQAVARLFHGIRVAAPIHLETLTSYIPDNPQGIPAQAIIDDKIPLSPASRPTQNKSTPKEPEIVKKNDIQVFLASKIEKYLDQKNFPVLKIYMDEKEILSVTKSVSASLASSNATVKAVVSIPTMLQYSHQLTLLRDIGWEKDPSYSLRYERSWKTQINPYYGLEDKEVSLNIAIVVLEAIRIITNNDTLDETKMTIIPKL
jgi:hypothetical protein